MDVNEIPFSHVLCNSMILGGTEQLLKSEQSVAERCSTCSLAVNSYKMLTVVTHVSNINCVCVCVCMRLKHMHSKQCLLASLCLSVSLPSVCT